RAIVKDMENAWNRGDGAGFANHMADQADFIDVLGRHHVGRQVIAEGHKGILSTIYKGSNVTYTVEKIRRLGVDVAIVFLRARLMTTMAAKADDANRENVAHGAPREEAARPTLMLEKQGGQWKVAAFQNTRIA
ncbi:MAG: SgcJ/EcaC family oxidoreductase, partial [Alphaproteobacteria bacterium]|nr:SgcJ/EcaC family oxidoreductase [Alphaproteobacteria bacterium]